MSARDVLRTLWTEGVKVTKRSDGSLALVPSECVSPGILELARSAKPEITELLKALPAPGRCPVCGSPNGWGDIDGNVTAHCVSCAQIAADRFFELRDISPKAQIGVAA